ncbi:MAG: hypothetical protein KGS48_01495 [Bacteroidetes bacterium]|nr:hypothetical protein [Bacteroidota bacterium]
MKNLLFALSVLCFTVHTACVRSPFARPVKYVAYLGFNYLNAEKDSANNYLDSLYIAALQTYIQRLNAQKDPKPYPVEFRLKTFQCDYKPDTIPLIYSTIAQDTNIALVIDNTWGRYIRLAAPIIRNQIPVISLSADQNRLDFGDNALFLQPNDPQPNYCVQFINKVLKTKSIGFVTECDYLLHNLFVESLNNNNMRYDSVCLWQRSYILNREVPKDSVVVMEQYMQKMLEKPQPEIILMNTHAGYGDSILRFLERKNLPPKTFVGISTDMSDQELEKITREKGHTFIRYASADEALPEKVYWDKQEIKKHFPKPFTNRDPKKEAQADNNLRRCYDAMQVLEIALDEKCFNRARLLHFFKGLKNRKISRNDDLFEFDNWMIQRKDPSFDQIHGGKTRSCPTQINTYGEPIANLRVGIDVIDINDIDVRKNTFDCNLLYWVIADSQYIKKEGYIDFSTISSEEANRYLIAEERDSNYVVRIYRISGKFLGNFKSFKFPFDHHELKIPIAALSSSNKIRISFDFSRLQINDKVKDFQFNDWDTESYFVTLDNQLSNAMGSLDKVTFDPDDKAKYLENYKSLNVHLGVSRQPWGAIILIILPFLMFSALPIFMLFFHKASYEEVGELIITSFLATVAYSINLVQISPATDSMNLAYLFLMLTLAVNFFCFIYVTISDRQKKRIVAVVETALNQVPVKPRPNMLKVWAPMLILLVFLFLLYWVLG